MTKNEAIDLINQNVHINKLNTKNTHYSNIVKYSNDDGWWINIPFKKFTQDLNLILNNSKDNKFTHIEIKANSIINPNTIFRDKDGLADIFIPLEKKEIYISTNSIMVLTIVLKNIKYIHIIKKQDIQKKN